MSQHIHLTKTGHCTCTNETSNTTKFIDHAMNFSLETYSHLSHLRFRGMVRGRPSTRSTASPGPRSGSPERSQSRDDDFLGENARIGEVVGLFEAFAFKPVDAEDGFVPIQKVPV